MPVKIIVAKLKIGEYSPDRLKALQDSGVDIEQIKKQELLKEGDTMKNEDKKSLANELVQWFEEKKVALEDRRKILSCCYRLCAPQKK